MHGTGFVGQVKINPEQYLTDVLIRVQTWPNHQIAELLPDRWRPPDGG